MARSNFSDVDEYGFQRPADFDYNGYENFMSKYMGVLTRRAKRWGQLKDGEKRGKGDKLKRFVRKGIPGSLRRDVWMAISGALASQQGSVSKYSALKESVEKSIVTESIEIDLPRTFPENIYFQNQSDRLPRQLFNVLATFAQQNLDVGYCQGLNYIAGLLLLATKSEEITFWLLKALVEDILPQYYIRSMAGLITDLAVLDELVLKSEPLIHGHIKAIGMPWAVTTTKWFICLYAEVLPTETVLRIWDCLFYEGSKIVFRVALTLIKIHKQEILSSRDLAELVGCFKSMGQHPRVIDCHQFVADMFKMPGSFSSRTLEKLRKKHQSADVVK